MSPSKRFLKITSGVLILLSCLTNVAAAQTMPGGTFIELLNPADLNDVGGCCKAPDLSLLCDRDGCECFGLAEDGKDLSYSCQYSLQSDLTPQDPSEMMSSYGDSVSRGAGKSCRSNDDCAGTNPGAQAYLCEATWTNDIPRKPRECNRVKDNNQKCGCLNGFCSVLTVSACEWLKVRGMDSCGPKNFGFEEIRCS